MSHPLLLLADAIAITVLTFVVYFPRYRRRDMVVALVGINVGVLSVATVLSESTVSAGLGLGLFGVLSIIRLRSSELDQEEVAYYFAALALGLIGGIATEPTWVGPVLMAGIIVALYIAGHPALFGAARSQRVILDTAIADEAELHQRLEALLDGSVQRTKVRRIDLVNDTTTVDVRFNLNSPNR